MRLIGRLDGRRKTIRILWPLTVYGHGVIDELILICMSCRIVYAEFSRRFGDSILFDFGSTDSLLCSQILSCISGGSVHYSCCTWGSSSKHNLFMSFFYTCVYVKAISLQYWGMYSEMKIVMISITSSSLPTPHHNKVDMTDYSDGGGGGCCAFAPRVELRNLN